MKNLLVTGYRRAGFLALAFLVSLVAGSLAFAGRGDDAEPAKVFGRIQYVTENPDVKVRVVTSMADLRVQIVGSFADEVGEWEIVDDFPDFRVQIVEGLEDFTIEYVEAFPGVR